MAKLKDHLITLREQLEEKYNRSFACLKCNDTGFVEIEIMGGSESDEWGVVDVKKVSCDKCF